MTLSETDSEQQLIRFVKQGDATVMRKIYSTYVRYLTAVCSRYVVNSEDVKDVLQESFMKIFSEVKSFEYRGEGSLKGWMTKITVNEALKHLKKNDRFDFVELTEQEHNRPDDEPDVDALPADVLFDLIRELPDGYRTVFNLYVIEGRNHKEIAKMLGIKESTSASQLHRAKSLLATNIRRLIPKMI